MKAWPLIIKSQVSHIGSMDREDCMARRKHSYEAFCLSVSDNPEEWRAIAKLGDHPCWSLSREGSFFVDAHALAEVHADELRSWAISEGIATSRPLWKAWMTDEDGDWFYLTCSSKQEAEAEVEGYDIEPSMGPAPDGSCVEEISDIVLTEEGLQKLQRWGDPLSAIDGALILFCREIIAPTDENIVGIWWDDLFDPSRLSCARGGIFPERLSEFEIERSCQEHDQACGF